MAERSKIEAHLDRLLDIGRYKDYGPNGLQVEGRSEVRKVVSGVTASLALIEAAIAAGADAMLVHHGLFWRGQDGRLVGWLRRRVALLMAHDISLYAYHLPLDAHPELGNNAGFGRRLGIVADARFGDQDLGFAGSTGGSLDLATLRQRVLDQFGRVPVVVAGDARPIRRIGWCTGGAQGYFEAAIAAGVDAFLTGEISEPQAHLARETGVAFLACGHHASERDGAAAVGAHLAREFGLEHEFIDLPNPA